MKKLLVILACILSLPGCASKSELYIRDRVVKLVGNNHSCSGEQVRAPSGADYILTAAHCNVLIINGSIEVISEDGRHLQRRVIEEDKKSDLMLLEGLPNLRGLDIAKKIDKFHHVRTFTHGKGYPTYKTEGTIIGDSKVDVLLDFISDSYPESKCSMPKNKVEEIEIFPGISIKICLLSVAETVTTAFIVPGSSGGMVVDVEGNLVGVVSAGGDGFGYLVTLSDIQKFVNNY